VPILFINGDRDRYTSVEDARDFNRYVRRSSFATIQGAGHFLDMESREAWIQTRDAVLQHLAPDALVATEPVELHRPRGAQVIPMTV
jgi:pimeloyl-ACP methyl ester carboxylesterase